MKFKRFTGAIARHLVAFVSLIMEDLLILCGLGAVAYATFQLNFIAGWYCLGACLFGLGAWMTAHPKRK